MMSAKLRLLECLESVAAPRMHVLENDPVQWDIVVVDNKVCGVAVAHLDPFRTETTTRIAGPLVAEVPIGIGGKAAAEARVWERMEAQFAALDLRPQRRVSWVPPEQRIVPRSRRVEVV